MIIGGIGAFDPREFKTRDLVGQRSVQSRSDHAVGRTRVMDLLFSAGRAVEGTADLSLLVSFGALCRDRCIRLRTSSW